MTTLKRCPRTACRGAVAYFRDERSDIPGEWKCLSCGRSFAVQFKVNLLHRQTGYPQQLSMWRADPVIER